MILVYYVGTMYAGKSAASLEVLYERLGYDHKLIVSGSLESRGFLSRKKEISHKAMDMATVVSSIKEIHNYDLSKKTLVFIDEVQFLDTPCFWELFELANAPHSTLDLILAGMKNCQYVMPFPMYNRLSSLLDPHKIVELFSKCATCGDEKGTTAIRKQFGESRITDCYSVMCTRCATNFIEYNNEYDQVPIDKLDSINLLMNEAYLNRAYRG